MPLRRPLHYFPLALLSAPVLAGAQQTTGIIRGRVSDAATSEPLPAVQVRVDGTAIGAQTGADGSFTIVGVPAGARTVTARRVGYAPTQLNVTVQPGATATQNFTLRKNVTSLNEVVVTALGRTTEQRALGSAQQQVAGAEIAQTQRENFVNALQGRVAGVNVTSSSGVPGASTSITIRGISSISSSNQPLFIVDGLPIDNKTLNTSALASDAPGSNTAFNNRGVDFTNRAADINPEDIETITVLKGAEAAALYGIDAANGAIVITTKRGRTGTGGFTYSNAFRAENVRGRPDIQRTYGPTPAGLTAAAASGQTTLLYFGPKYADTTTFYDNVAGFFRTGTTQQHNLAFSGASPDGRVNYRIAGGVVRQNGVVPNTAYGRTNLTGSSGGTINKWLSTDVALTYSYANNDQTYKGNGGPLIGLLVWPSTDKAQDYLTAAGTRRQLTTLSTGAEVDNPYFSVNRNRINSKNGRFVANLGITVTPFSWGNIATRLGADSYTNQNQLVRDPQSALGNSFGGVIDNADDVTRNLNAQTLLNINSHQLTRRLSISGLLGNQVSDAKSVVDGLIGTNFLDPNFVSVNNALNRSSRRVTAQRRLVGAFGQAVLNYDNYLYLTLQGRNDWTSTIPQGRNSFFYPSVTSSFIFSDAFPTLRRFMTGKLRGAYAEVGRDARPYAYSAFLENKTTNFGGYGYGFYGPNPNLRPEFARSYEVGTEMTFLNDRLGIDATVYRKRTTDQIVNDVRGSYATGFILLNLNGAATRNQGVELSLRGTPVQRRRFSWDVIANFDKHHGEVTALPNDIPEAYVSDTWLYGNIRSGTRPGLSTESLTGLYYLRNNRGKILIDPTSGLPLRSTTFVDAGYDRTPKYTIGLTNNLKAGRFSLNVLLDLRRGGDIFNATEHFLTTRGLSTETRDRDVPRVIDGVLRDGRENSANPTANTIAVVPGIQTNYYTGISEELFIEKNINWVRLRDVRLNYTLPARFARNASLYVSGTDLFILTNYTGMDPVVNGNTAAVGGSGAAGIDFGNFPIPRGINFGLTLGF